MCRIISPNNRLSVFKPDKIPAAAFYPAFTAKIFYKLRKTLFNARSAVPSREHDRHDKEKARRVGLDSGGRVCYASSRRGAATAPVATSPVQPYRARFFVCIILPRRNYLRQIRQPPSRNPHLQDFHTARISIYPFTQLRAACPTPIPLPRR